VELDRDRLRAAGWIVAAVVVALLGVRLLSAGAAEPPPVVEAGPGGAAGASGGSGAAGPAGPELLVQVAGEVGRPGVYRVPQGARVQDAVERAGGLTRRSDQAGVNLVARLADGQQVIVPRRGSAPVAAGGGGPGGGAAAPGPAGGAKVSLGGATPEQLDGIDGIGPTLARRIVEYRQQHGGFRSVDELRQVDGIGEKRFEALRAAVTP
jgi:competence protein ComEA